MPEDMKPDPFTEALEWLHKIHRLSPIEEYRRHAATLAAALRVCTELGAVPTELLADAECAKVVDIAVSVKTLQLGAVRVVASERVPPHQAYIRCLNRTIGVITNLGGEA